MRQKIQRKGAKTPRLKSYFCLASWHFCAFALNFSAEHIWASGLLLALGIALGGCRATPETPPANSANANNATVSVPTPAPVVITSNANLSPPAITNTNTPNPVPLAPVGQPVPAREPEQYRATLTLKLNAANVLTADVARNGTDRRWDFKLSDGTKIIYLYQTDRLFFVLPDKKIYAEQEGPAGIFALPVTLDPEKLVAQLRGDARYTPTGDAKFANRKATQYHYTGGVDSSVFVDKETGLPLHVEMAQARPGAEGAFIPTVIELSRLTADIPLKHFDEPRDMQKVDTAQMQPLFTRLEQTAAGQRHR